MADPNGVTAYPDHGSPVRRAREEARARVPCPGCGFSGEPVLRKPRPYTREWERDPSTYFGCSCCGNLLAPLSGPAANRPPDVSSDGLPDPDGLLEKRIRPALDDVPPAERAQALERVAQTVAGEHGLGFRSGSRVALLWRGRPWLILELEKGAVKAVRGRPEIRPRRKGARSDGPVRHSDRPD